ncbi:glutathione S-transferase family protein [Algiphilus sp.]|uniref:glutathione S-transferase family protein n=1 Tax=Algiphilus sp. TaxID=1872431 RepID=UPI0025BACE72|nr:glutathione S-transferase family protein [Algiphilus sp.]MCK5770250.1 glutathione S-transferase family protein [Algiphilus sp.]
MGRLVEGVWRDEWYDTSSTGGAFRREDAGFRNWVTADGSPGPSGEGGFAAESGRYHLYVSMACPWAHRTLVFRAIKGLTPHVGVSVVHPHMLENGWEYKPESEPLHGYRFHHQLYTHVKADYTGRVTVPVLWDRQRETIVSNESAEIIRMFNSAFDGITGNTDDYCPAELRDAIDAVNAQVYDTVNNGVYRCGFATTQAAYEAPFHALFATLDELEKRLDGQRWLCGDRLTEADWRLFTTLVRFDAVYHGHFKCNKRRIRDYPALSRYLRALLAVPGVADTVDIEQCKQHYYVSHGTINPTGVVPLGPDPLF